MSEMKNTLKMMHFRWKVQKQRLVNLKALQRKLTKSESERKNSEWEKNEQSISEVSGNFKEPRGVTGVPQGGAQQKHSQTWRPEPSNACKTVV